LPRSSAEFSMAARTCADLPWPSCATSSAASPDTCGAEALVPTPPSTVNPLLEQNPGTITPLIISRSVLAQAPHTRPTPMMFPDASNDKFPPGAATSIADDPKFV